MKITFKEKGVMADNGKAVLVTLVAGKKESEVVRLPNGQRVIEIGVENPAGITRRKLVLLARRVIAMAKSHKAKRVLVKFSDFLLPHLQIKERDLGWLMAVNFEMANFEFVKYKTAPEEGWPFIDEVVIVGKISAEAKKGFAAGGVVGEEVNKCRALANTPGGEMTPQILGEEARKVARGTKVKVTILGKKEIEKLKMGGVLGVSKGSAEEPRFIILEYWGVSPSEAAPFAVVATEAESAKDGAKKEKPIVLVGKGVTFDTGGLNLKPSQHIYEMHMDMSGGAAVIHAIVAAARLGIKKNVVGLVPAVENMPSGSSYHPGDVLVSMSGKTIEVLDTDAEGRIILADALTYAKKYNPKLVVDVATLTGAAMVAVGQRASAIFTSDEKLEQLFRELGEESGDYVWPLPLWEEFEEEIKGTFGDVANVGKTRYGGAITAAVFLHQFIKKDSAAGSGQLFPWVHIDIAPRMTAVEGEHLAKGAAGAPVRLLVKLIEKF